MDFIKQISKDNKVMKSTNNADKKMAVEQISGTTDGGMYGHTNRHVGADSRDYRMMFPFGISSRPPSDVASQVISDGKSFGSIVGIFDENRPQAEVGEAIIYSLFNALIKLDKNGDIAMRCANNINQTAQNTYEIKANDVKINSQLTSVTGDVIIGGSVSYGGGGEITSSGSAINVNINKDYNISANNMSFAGNEFSFDMEMIQKMWNTMKQLLDRVSALDHGGNDFIKDYGG